tara:strand:+ start:317 stop:577 length:261 start_codon:yes stop_codon:yes gene_type:complete
MVDFTLGKCKTKATFKTNLKKKGKLNLKKIAEKFEVVMETPILLVVKVDNIEIIVHGYGELLFKKCEDTEFMEKVAEEIYSVGLEE